MGKARTTRGPAKAELEALKQRIPYLGDHGLLVIATDGLDDRALDLARRIGLVDKRAHRQLGVGTAHWEDVIRLLVDAISIGLEGGKTDRGFELAREAEQLLRYYRVLPVRNRALYISGTMLGVGVAAGVGAGLGYLLEALGLGTTVLELVTMCLVAALGSIASVMIRLDKMHALDEDQPSGFVLMSGATRPLVAALLSVAVFLVLDLGVVVIQLGKSTSADGHETPALRLVAAFLCGFSERFARDLLAAVTPVGRDAPPEE